MFTQQPISSIMTRDVITVEANSKLKAAERIMKKNHIRHMPVVKDDQLVGMLSLNDLLRLSFVDAYGLEEEEEVDTTLYQMLTVEQVMVNKPRSVRADQSVRQVAEVFAQEDFHALPVVEGKKLVGIVTTTDIIRYMLANT